MGIILGTREEGIQGRKRLKRSTRVALALGGGNDSFLEGRNDDRRLGESRISALYTRYLLTVPNNT